MRWNRLVVAGLCLPLLCAAVSEASAQSEEKAFDPNQGGLVLRGGDGDELPALETPGARAKLIRPRGTNEWRGSGFALWTGGELSTDGGGGRLDSLRVADVEGGGPLVQDRLWIWAEAGRDEIDRVVLGGQTEERVRDSGSFRLNAQLAHPTSVELAASGGNSEGSGVGAGPSRSPEATGDEDGRESSWSAEATHIVGSSFYLTGAWSGSRRSVLDLPRGDGDARIDAAGVARGSWFVLEEEQRTREARLSGSAFFNTGCMSHEVAFGSGLRRQDEAWSLISPDRLGIAGELFDLSADVAEAWRSGTADARLETRSLWSRTPWTPASRRSSWERVWTART